MARGRSSRGVVSQQELRNCREGIPAEMNSSTAVNTTRPVRAIGTVADIYIYIYIYIYIHTGSGRGLDTGSLTLLFGLYQNAMPRQIIVIAKLLAMLYVVHNNLRHHPEIRVSDAIQAAELALF